ncbi:MAG: dockerin type I repeat-containing protein [Phycisphaerales bacterium]|nr:dockerin type I repeat-containing protein [Phycisphaerales bacterium]
MRTMQWVIAVLLGMLATEARAQFDTPGSTDTRQRVAGVLTSQGGPIIEAGDQIGAFAGDLLVGSFTFTGESAATGEFAFMVFGDDANTEAVDGAEQNVLIEFRFYDGSSNTEYHKLGVKNTSGENYNYKYAGQVLPPFDLPGFPIELLVPTQSLDLVVTSDTTNSGGTGSSGTGGEGGGSPAGSFDVDGDGKVTTRDAALVLRIVSGSATVSAEVLQRADVNGDQVVSTEDAISVLRNR